MIILSCVLRRYVLLNHTARNLTDFANERTLVYIRGGVGGSTSVGITERIREWWIKGMFEMKSIGIRSIES